MVIRRRLRKQRATAAMQHAGRFMFAQLLMSALKVLQSKRQDHDDESAKAGDLPRDPRLARPPPRASARTTRSSSTRPRRRSRRARARHARPREGRTVSSDHDLRYAAAQTVQAYTRRFHAQITHGAYIKALRLQLPTVQRTVRGFNARRKVAYEKYLHRPRGRWIGLGNDAPSRSAKAYAMQLPKYGYRLRDRAAEARQRARLAEAAQGRLLARRARAGVKGWSSKDDEKYFLAKEVGAGTCSRFEFRMAVRRMWAEKGALMTPLEAAVLVKLFDKHHDGFARATARDFLPSTRARSIRPCDAHRRIICGECTARGVCERARCSARSSCPRRRTARCSPCRSAPTAATRRSCT